MVDTALFNKGLALYKEKKYEDAIIAFDEAIRLNPQYTKAWNNKGIALSKLDRYEDAIKAYDVAIEIDPKDAGALNNKGIALGKLNRYEDAIKAYDEAIEIDPKYIRALINKSYILYQLGDYKGSNTSIDKSLQFKKTARAYLLKGKLLINKAKFEEAIDDFERAKQLAPWNINTNIWRIYAKCLMLTECKKIAKKKNA